MGREFTKVQRDDEGYLIEPDDWTLELAHVLAREESLELGQDHWTVLQFVRDYYVEHGITPDVRHAARYFAEQNGLDLRLNHTDVQVVCLTRLMI